MKFKTKLGEIETNEVFDSYSDDLRDINNEWFKKDTYPGVGEDGGDYRLHYVDNLEIWVAVKI